MSDRLKFRVWDKERKCFFNDEEVVIYPNGEVSFFNADYDFAEIVVNQCTGLKDKNGKLIYEGDIIQTDYNGVELDKYIYRWESPAFYVEPIEKGKPTGSHYYHYAVCTERSTVIGNIHENQELLKGEE